MIFPKEFYPKRIKDCSIQKSRKKFKNKKNKNTIFLLEERFFWMKKYLKGKKIIIELGCGNGASKDILNNKNILLTDIQKYPWISKKVDMENDFLLKGGEELIEIEFELAILSLCMPVNAIIKCSMK